MISITVFALVLDLLNYNFQTRGFVIAIRQRAYSSPNELHIVTIYLTSGHSAEFYHTDCTAQQIHSRRSIWLSGPGG